MFRKLMFLVIGLALVMAGAGPALASSGSGEIAGAVYVMNNSTVDNQVLVYNRTEDGRLSFAGAFSTGGLGSGAGVTVPPDPLGSQNSLLLNSNGQWLFAVNAGSNEISVFRTLPGSLRLVDKINSGGVYPVSLAFDNNLLYVLNAGGDGNISGFQVSNRGKLSSLDDSTRSLNAATPNDGSQPQILESPAQVGFSPNGKALIVTDKGGVSGQGLIKVFQIGEDGLPSENYISTPTQNPVPFSFTFDPYGHLVVVDAGASMVTSYSLHNDGSLSVNSSIATGQAATCWIVSNGKYLFTDNTGAGNLSSIQTTKDGDLSFVNSNPIAISTGSGALPIDMAVSHNGKFVYSLETGLGKVGMFRIGADGSLTSLGIIAGFPPIGAQGIAAW